MNELKPTQFVRRCKWCILRIGSPRYVIGGDWKVSHVKTAAVFAQSWPVLGRFIPEQGPFTDGICPDCFAKEMAKVIKSMPEHLTLWPTYQPA